jgi:uncharacterized membrane protein
MTPALLLTLAFALGVIAGLRALTALMVVSWAARLKWLDLDGTWASFLGGHVAPLLLTVLAAGEFVGDQLPKTPSRTAPLPLLARILSGGFSGAVLGTGSGTSPVRAAAVGALGAVVGTFGGHAVRTRLVKTLKVPDAAVAIPEDLVAIVGGFLIVAFLFYR